MDETQKRSLSELHERLGHNISDKKSLPADNNVFLPDAGDEHNSPDHEQTGSPKPEYRKNTTVGNQLLRNESVITRFRRLSLIGKDDTAREDKSVIGKFRRRTYSVMQSNIETSVDGNNKSSFFGSKMSHENETDSSGKRESLRSSLMTSIKKVKDKLQGKFYRKLC